MKKTLTTLMLTLVALIATAQQLIPEPQQMKVKKGASVTVTKIDAKVNPGLNLPKEGYTLTITPAKAVLRAKTPQGLIWARQTLRQLTDPQGKAPQVIITDYPAYPLRGFMYDTGRNFMEVSMLKQYIDLLSAYKLNAFHWHLTDNPAWRIESHAYPQLNDAKNQTKGRDEGKYYTYDQIREVIAYARERGVMIIPEIDMPGHSRYFQTTFGFTMGTPEGMQVLEKCLKEFFTEIPVSDCPYIHIGSDEVNISDPEGFMLWAETLVRTAGRTPIAWDPGLPSGPNTIRMKWNTSKGDIDTSSIDGKGKYLDSYMGYLNDGDPLVATNRYYLRHICQRLNGPQLSIGGILCLWNDVRVADKTRISPHNGMVSGVLAFAERLWNDPKTELLANPAILPAPETEPSQALQRLEQKMQYHRDNLLKEWDMRWVSSSTQPWKVTLPIPRGTHPDQTPTISTWGGAVDLDVLFASHKVKRRAAMDAWATTEIHCNRDTTITAWVGFEAAGRASRRGGGIGYQGYWENDGRILVGNTEIFPPNKWNEPGTYRLPYESWGHPEEELPYTDEQFYWMRTPAQVPLKAGWNTITLYCPLTFPDQPWSFAFVPVTVDKEGHVREATGITFRMPAK